MWNNDRVRFLLVLVLSAAGLAQTGGPASANGDEPRLLMTPQRLHRLKLDRQRQTERWVDFENRVNTIPDSPQRGFELALYYAVTGDEARGREALAWAAAHQCDSRQSAIIHDWCGSLLPAPKQAAAADCKEAPGIESSRDKLFRAIAAGQDVQGTYDRNWKPVLAALEQGAFRDARQLYAAIEFIDAARANLHRDPREDDAPFFAILPLEILLSQTPHQVEHPDWMMHVAALALVAQDPNLASSQFLQGWAMEQRQTIREGPGVAYEFLWADPYLPGNGYQNLDPWIYDPIGRLYARTSWDEDACWIGISKAGVQESSCPGGWRGRTMSFGHMTLVPAAQDCTELPVEAMRSAAVVLWGLRPGETLSFLFNQKRRSDHADAAGLWRAPGGARGKVCRSR
jgi:hypothetical protein